MKLMFQMLRALRYSSAESRRVSRSGLKLIEKVLKAEHVDFHNGLEKQTVITKDGRDITDIVEKAVAWLTENSF